MYCTLLPNTLKEASASRPYPPPTSRILVTFRSEEAEKAYRKLRSIILPRSARERERPVSVSMLSRHNTSGSLCSMKRRYFEMAIGSAECAVPTHAFMRDAILEILRA